MEIEFLYTKFVDLSLNFKLVLSNNVGFMFKISLFSVSYYTRNFILQYLMKYKELGENSNSKSKIEKYIRNIIF